MPLFMFGWRFKMLVNYRQQVPPSLTFASPIAKPNLAMDTRVLEIWKYCSYSSKAHMYSTRIFLQTRVNYSDFQTYLYYL
jgi:hypothetical protein